VKVAAGALEIPTVEPEKVHDALAVLGATGADIFAVASYGNILPPAVLDLPRLGAFNVHPSLLPLYRGATPLQAQIRDGVTESGVTIIAMDAGMDTGDILLQERSPIGEHETYGELHDRFAQLGAELLTRACELAAAGRLERQPQAGLASPEAIAATTTRPLTKGDLLVDWRWPAQRTVNHVRSLSPAPGARAHLDGEAEMVKLLEVRTAAAHDPDELTVPCGRGEYVTIERLVPPSRKPMKGQEYLAAARSAAERRTR
jgi:methionyl-tRNA formyltransferase